MDAQVHQLTEAEVRRIHENDGGLHHEDIIMDAESEHVERLKSEIERLLTLAAKNENILLESLERCTQELLRLQAELRLVRIAQADREVPTEALQVEVYETTIRLLVEHNRSKNKIIRELLSWIESEFRLDTYPPESPGRKLWERAQEASK